MFINKLKELLNERGISKNKLLIDLELGKNSFINWESRGNIPNGETLMKLADYFNVSVDYLLGKETASPSLESTIKKGEVIFLPNSNAYMIPVFESVSAGFGTCPNENIVSYELCNINSPAEAAETICIKVKGDSMFPKIEDGDVIQVHKQTSVDSGKIAVVLLDGEEALVKKTVYGSDWIELQSFNPMYPVMRFDGRDVLRVQVLGLVRKIIKTC